jgi:RNA polymerase sigma-70 factor (ECF subfamily)
MESTMSAFRSGSASWSSEETFRSLFHRYYGSVFAYAARRLGRDEAGDAASEVFTVAWRSIRRIPEGTELPWLYGVARKVVANHRRSVARRLRLQERVRYAPPPPMVEERVDLDAVLASLSEADREVLMLAAWEGLDPTGMGQVLGCTANAAAVRLHRARVRLSEAWGHDDGGVR